MTTEVPTLAELLEETARKFGDARRQVAEDAIKHGLAHDWTQVYVWTTFDGTTWTAHASADFPTDTLSQCAQDIERFDLGKGLLLDRTKEHTP